MGSAVSLESWEEGSRPNLAQQVKIWHCRSSHGGSVKTSLTSDHEDGGSIPGLAQRVKALAWP